MKKDHTYIQRKRLLSKALFYYFQEGTGEYQLIRSFNLFA